MHRIIKVAAVAATSLIAIGAGSAAHASVNVNPTSTGGLTGFIGKGDVQTVLGMNNSALQKAVDATQIKFTSTQSASQALTSTVTQEATQEGREGGSQSGTQSATESATQSASRTVSCTIENKNKTFTNDGVRSGSRIGSHTGTRTVDRLASRTGSRVGTRNGSRTGTLNGVLAADIDAPARKTGQWTGWNVRGFLGQPTFGAAADATRSWGDPAWDGDGSYNFGIWTFGEWSPSGEWSFDAPYQFTGDYGFGPIDWSGWQAEPGENPADCLGGNPGVSDIVDVTTYGTPVVISLDEKPVQPSEVVPSGEVMPLDVVPAPATYGDTVPGVATGSGPLSLFVSYNGGSARPLPITQAV